MSMKKILMFAGVAAAAIVLYKAFNRDTVANASGVTSTNKGGLTTTPIQVSRLAFAKADSLVSTLIDTTRSVAKSTLSLVIPARTDALQPNGNPRSNLAAYQAPLQPRDKVSAYSVIK